MSVFNKTINNNNNNSLSSTINLNIILDSGALEHYTLNKDQLLDYKPVTNKSIIIINSQKLPIIGTGDMPIIINNIKVLITGVNYILNIKNTLISSKELINKDQSIYF